MLSFDGVYFGLSYAWDLGFHKITVETDFLDVVRCLKALVFMTDPPEAMLELLDVYIGSMIMHEAGG
ncbi:hypothetical protein V6N12_067701 [Hibiscus sabdariffa]|uniref:RNase H type-1 domain-containing protein n=1 Tax=Hibiscus sabdariffa TaxID=183260 RepID=A0ABR2B7S3_9ROSI